MRENFQSLELSRQKLPNIGNFKPQNFQPLEKLIVKLPIIGNFVWENFQSLEELRSGKLLPSGVRSQRSQKKEGRKEEPLAKSAKLAKKREEKKILS